MDSGEHRDGFMAVRPNQPFAARLLGGLLLPRQVLRRIEHELIEGRVSPRQSHKHRDQAIELPGHRVAICRDAIHLVVAFAALDAVGNCHRARWT